jgi:uncharacterized protein
VTETLKISSADGVALEAELDRPDDAKAGLVFCHPHPKMGGTMNAPLLLAVRDEMVGRGWAVLRFNFRGIGDSEGESSMGVEEVADARGALKELRKALPDAPVAIAGWSFGGAVAVRTAAEDPDLVACTAIAPAVTERPAVTAGLPPPHELALSMPVLFLCGSNDDQVPPEECRAWVEELPAGTYEEIPGANHFFWAKYDRLTGVIADFLDNAIKGTGG